MSANVDIKWIMLLNSVSMFAANHEEKHCFNISVYSSLLDMLYQSLVDRTKQKIRNTLSKLGIQLHQFAKRLSFFWFFDFGSDILRLNILHQNRKLEMHMYYKHATTFYHIAMFRVIFVRLRRIGPFKKQNGDNILNFFASKCQPQCWY